MVAFTNEALVDVRNERFNKVARWSHRVRITKNWSPAAIRFKTRSITQTHLLVRLIRGEKLIRLPMFEEGHQSAAPICSLMPTLFFASAVTCASRRLALKKVAQIWAQSTSIGVAVVSLEALIYLLRATRNSDKVILHSMIPREAHSGWPGDLITISVL